MISQGLRYPIAKFANRVLADYPLARERLAKHAGKTVEIKIGPIENRMRIGAAGEMEMVGEGAGEAADVSMQIPLGLLPRLARKDESAFSEVAFVGDSELASTLSTVARNVKWDVEEDLSRVIGDVAAHRVVSGVESASAFTRDAHQRFNENLAEYLTEEKRLFISQGDLESLASANETLRDDLARLDARIQKISKQ